MCDKCGTTLSDDNVAHCYSAEPKRPCLETHAGDAAPSQCNGDSPSTTTAAISTSASSSSTADTSVRPQALYVNVNNQAFPVLGVTATTASASRPFVAGTTQVNSSVSRPGSTTVLATSQSSVPVTRSLPNTLSSSQPRPGNISSSVTLPTYNLQPPQHQNITRIPVQGLVSSTLNTPVQSATVATAVSSYVFQVNAIQIRLGAKKFKPLTAVTFKDDGVLFTLTGLLLCVIFC